MQYTFNEIKFNRNEDRMAQTLEVQVVFKCGIDQLHQSSTTPAAAFRIKVGTRFNIETQQMRQRSKVVIMLILTCHGDVREFRSP